MAGRRGRRADVRSTIAQGRRNRRGWRVSLTAVGYPTQPENMYWDCFSFTPEPGTDSVTFEARSGGRVVQKTFRVVEPSW